MAFWIEVGWARAAEDREVQVGVAQGFGCYLYAWTLAATSLEMYYQARFQTDTHGGLEIMTASDPSHCRASAGQNSCLHAADASGTSAPGKEYPYHHLFLDPIALTPLVSIGFESNPFPIIIHA